MSTDGGSNVVDVTPDELPESIINVVEPSSHDPAKAYFVAAGYKLDDFTPYVFRTNDYGETWTKIIDGVPGNTFARTIREDPDREGLLYLGTENGLFLSFNDGESWQPFQRNLPQVPITDLRVRQKDLVVATQGRSIWILDDLTPLHQVSLDMADGGVHLYDPRDPYRLITSGYYAEGGPGENPPSGMQVNYVLGGDVPADVPMSMEILNAAGEVVFAEHTDDPRPDCEARPRPRTLERTAGAHRWSWNMRVGRFACIAEVYRTQGDLSAYEAMPGSYRLRLTVGDVVQTQDFEILIDPRLMDNAADPMAAYRELNEVSERLFAAAQEMEQGVLQLRQVRQQVDFLWEITEDADILEGAGALNEAMEEWESRILQRYLETGQNNYMFEARLLVKFKDLLGRISGANIPVTSGVREVAHDYGVEWTGHRTDLVALKERIRAFNTRLLAAGLPEIYLPPPPIS
jgi:hypothetical protein